MTTSLFFIMYIKERMIVVSESITKSAVVLLPLKRPEDRRRFEELAPEWTFFYEDDAPIQPEQFENAFIIFGNPSKENLSHCKHLKWVQLGSAGSDVYTQNNVFPPYAALTNASGAYGPAISEYMVAVTFSLLYNLPLYRDNQQAGQWKSWGSAKCVEGSTVLSVGMGDIGGSYARKMKSLGCTVYGIRRTKALKPDYIDGLFQMDKLEDLLKISDIIALSLPQSPQTQGLFSRDRIEKIKKDAVLINVGRGSAIDTEALCDALENGHLRGAALDVTDPEPLPPDHRLWRLPNAIITPHISGGYTVMKTYDRIIEICLKNFSRFLNGEELFNLVDFKTGYRVTQK